MQTEDVKNNADVIMKEITTKRNYMIYAGMQLGIHVRTSQRWVKQYERKLDSIFERPRKTDRSRILKEEHKKVVLEYIDENSSFVLEQIME
ncbi:hypothetical protein G6F57_004109 [Rhizopus arrhizus]|uniref:Uncharacterized protein n=1 Tax=Rhizopus oryzae TaxID=64495 RepID=A0A9P7BY44_RHIOR|nr:hypothetical protein G6F23_007318 [Rhizopus arrhizus]KAG1423166.1 hypothetical protein G6F58_002945 [Rhizopus delemar]KAG0911849.1 hypothetical protein G6F33_006620 [Rhizopus arrhizus]KAG0943178.1 hypothetical protein G6F30_005385 [Rhizopus arrhizus]KAG0946493.1 hypothetical protein G6F32_006540 [Rhizopus arrhizus]